MQTFHAGRLLRRIRGGAGRVTAVLGMVGLTAAGALSAHAAASSDRALTVEAPSQLFVGVPQQYVATVTNNGPGVYDPSTSINDLDFLASSPSVQREVKDVDQPDCTLTDPTSVTCELSASLGFGESFVVRLTAVAGGQEM